MKLFIVILFLNIWSVNAYADDFFTETHIKDLCVIETSKEEGAALIIDKKGKEADIYIGDVIGIDRGIVVEIADTYITLKIYDTMVKIRIKKSVN